MGHERSRSIAAGEVVALQPSGMRAGARLAAVRDVAMLRLFAGGAGAAIRPQRELETVAMILHRASRRVAEAAMEMTDEQQQQAQRHIEGARLELDRISQRMENEHAEPGAENHDSGTQCQRSIDERDCASNEGV